MAMLEVEHLKKTYVTRFGGNQVQALTDVNLTVEKGEYVAIMGESGSGKTTLLNILAALDKPTSGVVRLNGKALSDIGDREPSAGTTWALCSRTLTCWTPFPCGTTSFCPWCSRAKATAKWRND